MDFAVFQHNYPIFKRFSNPNCVFLYACEKGMLSLAQDLIKYFPNIGVDIDNRYFYTRQKRNIKEDAFDLACQNNNIKVAKWLKLLWPQINHRINNDEVIQHSRRYSEVIKWLISFYTIRDIKAVINIFFSHDDIDYIRYIIEEFDLVELTIGPQYQSEFDNMVAEYQSSFNNRKSARKH